MAQYDSFLVQVWRNNRRGGHQLSARLEHLQDGHCVQCVGLDALLALLRDYLDGGIGATTQSDEERVPER